MDVLNIPVPKGAYSEFWALRDINLSVASGQRLGIIGRNGAGKSTLLKIVAGQLQPTAGNVMVCGKVQALMELGTGFHPEFTGRQNVFAALSYQGIIGKKARQRFDEVLEFSELEDFIDNPFKTYSSGMQARLAFSVATAIEPEILIIDEVLGAGDAYFAGKCVDRMKRLTLNCGATILFVSHDLNAVQAMCDRAVWLKRGHIIQEGNPLSVTKAYYKEVREEENVRLIAQSQGLSKNKAIMLRESASFKPVLFHFITTCGGPLKGKHKIRHLSLYSGDKMVGEISVGDAMDNSNQEPFRIICQTGYTDWFEPRRDEKGYYRFYADCQGRYHHAPFQFDVPTGLYLEGIRENNFYLQVLSDFSPADETCIEIYEGEGYRRLGIVVPGEERQIFKLYFDDRASEVILEPSKNSQGMYLTYRFFFESENQNLEEAVLISHFRISTHKNEDIFNSLNLGDEHNNNNSFQYIGQNSWGAPKEVRGVLSRSVMRCDDRTLAGFEVKLPLDRARLFAEHSLIVHTLSSKANGCRVFLEDMGRMVRIGEIFPEEEPRWCDYTFDLDIVSNLDTDYQNTRNNSSKSLVTWQVPDPRIDKVRFLDGSGKAVTGIEEGEDLVVEINYYSSYPVADPIFAASIYLLDGTIIRRATSRSSGFEIKSILGSGKVRFIFAPFYGGPNEYIVSAGIYKHLDLTKHSQSVLHDQHDRAYRFRVWKKLGIVADMGLLNIPYSVEHVKSV
jgi:ABC-type polysaccharide/polyol phosphate transport system ATPase subunit